MHSRVGVACRQDDGRPATVGVIQGANTVGQSAGDVDVREGGTPGGPCVTVGHAHRRTLLEGLNVADFREILQHVQKRGLAGAGVAKDVGNALGD